MDGVTDRVRCSGDVGEPGIGGGYNTAGQKGESGMSIDESQTENVFIVV